MLPGRSANEILFSTYCCHPAMANNELTGPVLAVALAAWPATRLDRRYPYRFVFVSEMIRSAAVLEAQREHLRVG